MTNPKRRIRISSRVALLVALALAVVGPLRSARAADTFYTGLLLDGSLAYARGDHASAARKLRIACFGFLDEPELLVEGLVRLALAQSANNDGLGFEDAIGRIVEVEERLGGYTSANIPTELRSEFEQEVIRWLPADQLRLYPIFQNLVEAELEVEEQAPSLSPKQARAQLEARALRENKPDLYFQLAELDFTENNPRQALDWLEFLLEVDPDYPGGRCLRGELTISSKYCQQAHEDLESCPDLIYDAGLATEHLRCLVRWDRWEEADQLLAALPAEVTAAPKVEKLQTKVAKAIDTAKADALAAPDEAAPAQTTASPSVAPVPRPEDQAELLDIRSALGEARNTQQVLLVLDQAIGLAERTPSWVESQFFAAKTAYMASRWPIAVDYFRRGGEPGLDRPDLAFEFAVALYESGEQQAAAALLEAVLPAIKPSPFVDSYASKILQSSDGSETDQ